RFEGLAIGVRLEGLTVRVPATGGPTMDARVNEVFFRMKLLPLLFRRVEISAARVRNAWVTMLDQGVAAPAERGSSAGGAGAAQAALLLPRLEFENLNVRTRDPLGGGSELKGVSGHTEIAGALGAPSAIRISARAESLFWKPSAREVDVALPAPFVLDAALEAKGRERELRVTRGSVTLGPLESALDGTLRFVEDGPRPDVRVDLKLRGKPQEIRSGDRAWKALAAKSPAAWNGTASWDLAASGSASALAMGGTVTVKPLSIKAGANEFALDRLEAVFTSHPDRTFTGNAKGEGSGVALTVEAEGSMAPGGATSGVLLVRAPAARLNGLVPNAPSWKSGDLECRATFELRPPAEPRVRWVVKGKGINGTVQGLARPLRGLEFHVEGNEISADVRSLRLSVGSTTANVTGTLVQGKPLGTGTFRIALDRLIAEEWAPTAGGAAPAKPAANAAPPPPVPLRSFDAAVEIGELRSGGMRVKNLTAPVRFDGTNVAVAPIRGAIGTGTLEGALDLRSLLASPRYSLHLDVKRAPVEEVASGTLPFKSAISGLLSGVVDLSGPGFPGPQAGDSLVGSLNGTVEQGKILPSPTLSKLTGSLGLAEQRDVAFQTLTHSLRIAAGRLMLDRIHCDMGADLAEMTGSVGLDRSLDLSLLLRLAPSRFQGGGTLREIARLARDEQGRVPIEVKIGGSDRAPTVSIAPGRALEIMGKQLREKLGSELTGRLTGGAKSGQPADSGRAAPSETADSGASDPLKKGREALKRLLGK
ncbi:MAG: hypothetical protein HY568_03710, partial [Candidatus Latescibacteria bacterium]|nr:hypothetical protein [Candidatus Latescibacterota bacterium]